jgi:thioredoxin-dependent peroxiredoxin
MAVITLKGKQVHTKGSLPAVGARVPDFLLTRADMSDARLGDFRGKRKIFNIVASLDTRVCATSARRFNTEAASIPNVVILTISNDLPYAQKRFCEAQGIDKVVMLSQLRNRDFGTLYGVEMLDGPMAGLLSRAVLVVDENDRVVHAEQVPEISQEPDYAKALAAAGAKG